MKRTFASLIMIYVVLLVLVVSPAVAQFGDHSQQTGEPYYGRAYRTESHIYDSQGLGGKHFVYDQDPGGRLFEQFCTLQHEGLLPHDEWGPTHFVTVGYYQYTHPPKRIVTWRTGGYFINWQTYQYPPLETYQYCTIMGAGYSWYVFMDGWWVKTITQPGYSTCNVSCEVSKRNSAGDCWGSFEELTYKPTGGYFQTWEQLWLYDTTYVATYKISNQWFMTWAAEFPE